MVASLIATGSCNSKEVKGNHKAMPILQCSRGVDHTHKVAGILFVQVCGWEKSVLEN